MPSIHEGVRKGGLPRVCEHARVRALGAARVHIACPLSLSLSLSLCERLQRARMRARELVQISEYVPRHE